MQFGATSEEHVMSKVIDQISTEEGSKPVPVEVLSVESFPDSDEPQAEEDKDTVQVKVLERQRLTEAATTLNQKQRADMSVYVVANPRATAQELMTEMYLVKKSDELYTQLGRYGQEYMNAYRAANSQASTEELLGEMQKIITARDSETPEEEAIALPVQSSTSLPPVNGSNGNGKASTGDKLSILPQKPATLSENGSSNGTVNGSSGNGVNSPATKLRDIIGASKK